MTDPPRSARHSTFRSPQVFRHTHSPVTAVREGRPVEATDQSIPRRINVGRVVTVPSIAASDSQSPPGWQRADPHPTIPKERSATIIEVATRLVSVRGFRGTIAAAVARKAGWPRAQGIEITAVRVLADSWMTTSRRAIQGSEIGSSRHF